MHISTWCVAFFFWSTAHATLFTPLTTQSCALDESLLSLAAKQFSLETLLNSPGRTRQCPPRLDGKRETRLIYVTPWNPSGYTYTTHHCEKLSHVAPVWYQVEVLGSRITLQGRQDRNETWLRSLSKTTKVVPRFEVKFASRKEIEAVLFFPRNEAADIVRRIVDEVVENDYAGATLEVIAVSQMKTLIRKLGEALHELKKELILVRGLFSLNAYDHTGFVGKETGNAPIQWTREILAELLHVDIISGRSMDDDDDDDDDDDPFGEDNHDKIVTPTANGPLIARKLLLGINFYGYTMTTDGLMNTITQNEYRDLLEFSQISERLGLHWNEARAEHQLLGSLWMICYPTLLSLLHRLDLAREFHIGVSVWEAGQGLEHFWDVL